MSNENSFDFESFQSANEGRNVSGFDYLHAIYKTQKLSSDFILWFAKLLLPEFKCVDNRIYVAELFDMIRYQELLKNGQSKNQAQFWMNLFEITGLFDDMSCNDAHIFAMKIAESWTAKIRTDFGPNEEGARVMFDNDTGEIFVVIGNESPRSSD